MPIAVDALEKSLRDSQAFFTSPDLMRKWAKFALIIMLFTLFTGEGIGGGGGSFSFPSGSRTSQGYPSASPALPLSNTGTLSTSPGPEAAPQVPSIAGLASMVQSYNINWSAIMVYVLVAIVLLMLLGFLLSIVGHAAMFAGIRCIRENDVQLSWIRENLGKGLSVSLLKLAICIFELPFILMFFLAVAVFFMSLISPLMPSPVSGANPLAQIHSYLPFTNNAGTMLMFLAVGFVGLVFFFFINYFLKQFGYYLMATEGCGAIEALSRGIRLGLGNIVELLILFVVQIAIGFGLLMASAIVGLILAVPLLAAIIAIAAVAYASSFSIAVLAVLVIIGLCLLLVFSYVSALVYSPVYVFIFNYNLNVLEGFKAKSRGLQYDFSVPSPPQSSGGQGNYASQTQQPQTPIAPAKTAQGAAPRKPVKKPSRKK
ncbi:Uncharacterised protein [uncultured archaeon]|nr:Uncharacterised protein [uncultured archaeon]